MALLRPGQDQAAVAADEANWRRLSAERRYREYLDGCRSVCAYRAVAMGYLGGDDPAGDGRVEACDRLAGAGFDPDRPKEVTRVCLGRIDAKAAVAACREAVEAHPGLRRLHYQLGRAHDAAGGYREARAAYEKAAAMGSAAALNNLATLHENGEGVPKSLAEAERLYRRGADAGSVTAMSNLARFMEYGHGGRKDLREAARWYKACGDREDPFCRTKHANLILSRTPGVEGDGLNAILMVRKSAEQGEVMALVTLATIIDLGFGSGAGATGTALDYLGRALKRGERAAAAMTVPDVFGKLKPETRTGLQRLARGAGYEGPLDGRLSPALVAALRRAAVAAERASKPEDFADAGESCG
jgi:TPR repeat protein